MDGEAEASVLKHALRRSSLFLSNSCVENTLLRSAKSKRRKTTGMMSTSGIENTDLIPGTNPQGGLSKIITDASILPQCGPAANRSLIMPLVHPVPLSSSESEHDLDIAILQNSTNVPVKGIVENVPNNSLRVLRPGLTNSMDTEVTMDFTQRRKSTDNKGENHKSDSTQALIGIISKMDDSASNIIENLPKALLKPLENTLNVVSVPLETDTMLQVEHLSGYIVPSLMVHENFSLKMQSDDEQTMDFTRSSLSNSLLRKNAETKRQSACETLPSDEEDMELTHPVRLSRQAPLVVDKGPNSGPKIPHSQTHASIFQENIIEGIHVHKDVSHELNEHQVNLIMEVYSENLNQEETMEFTEQIRQQDNSGNIRGLDIESIGSSTQAHSHSDLKSIILATDAPDQLSTQFRNETIPIEIDTRPMDTKTIAKYSENVSSSVCHTAVHEEACRVDDNHLSQIDEEQTLELIELAKALSFANSRDYRGPMNETKPNDKSCRVHDAESYIATQLDVLDQTAVKSLKETKLLDFESELVPPHLKQSKSPDTLLPAYTTDKPIQSSLGRTRIYPMPLPQSIVSAPYFQDGNHETTKSVEPQGVYATHQSEACTLVHEISTENRNSREISLHVAPSESNKETVVTTQSEISPIDKEKRSTATHGGLGAGLDDLISATCTDPKPCNTVSILMSQSNGTNSPQAGKTTQKLLEPPSSTDIIKSAFNPNFKLRVLSSDTVPEITNRTIGKPESKNHKNTLKEKDPISVVEHSPKIPMISHPVRLKLFLHDAGISCSPDEAVLFDIAAKKEVYSREATCSEYIYAYARMDFLRLYQFSCSEMQKNIAQGQRLFADLEAAVAQETPFIMKKYYFAGKDFRKQLNSELERIWSWAGSRLQHKWYQWRSQLLESMLLQLETRRNVLTLTQQHFAQEIEKTNQVLIQVCQLETILTTKLTLFRAAREAVSQLDQDTVGILSKGLSKVVSTLHEAHKFLVQKKEIHAATQKRLNLAWKRRNECADRLNAQQNVSSKLVTPSRSELHFVLLRYELLLGVNNFSISGIEGQDLRIVLCDCLDLKINIPKQEIIICGVAPMAVEKWTLNLINIVVEMSKAWMPKTSLLKEGFTALNQFIIQLKRLDRDIKRATIGFPTRLFCKNKKILECTISYLDRHESATLVYFVDITKLAEYPKLATLVLDCNASSTLYTNLSNSVFLGHLFLYSVIKTI